MKSVKSISAHCQGHNYIFVICQRDLLKADCFLMNIFCTLMLCCIIVFVIHGAYDPVS